MKFLIVSADAQQLQALAKRFTNRFSEEAEVITADSGIYALTSCDITLPNLIISAQYVGDMTGFELYKLIRQEPSFGKVPFILLDSAALNYPDLLPIDQVLETDTGAIDVMRATFEVLSHIGIFKDERAQERHDLQSSIFETAKASGTLDVLTLFDLSLSLSQSRQSGKLLVFFGSSRAALLFKEGQLINATIDDLTGEAAIASIFKTEREYPRAEFCFETLDSLSLPLGPHPIHMPINALLLKMAVSLDHQDPVASEP
jgi:CheY-like chemotaxis protein